MSSARLPALLASVPLMNLPLRFALVVLLVGSSSVTAAEPDAKGVEFFEKKIRPVLVEHCYSCHSQDAAKNKKLRGGLLLDSRAGLREGGDSGPAVVPGKAKDSLLLKTLSHADDMRMPPKQKLPDAVIADFARWVEMGAPDPRDGKAAPVRAGIDLEEGRKFWAFQPLGKYEPPAVKEATWPRDPLDRFVLAKLDAKGLRPVADADRQALLRRVYFDLIGLPPTPEQVEAFVQDASPDAFAKVVDGLLASPHFGERWGRHWLDLARFSESNGRDRNMVWHHAWRYRDWVIDAVNRDKPFDRFVREQVAGDLLPAATPAERDAQRVATGFLAMGPKAFEERKREVFRMDMIDEQIDVLSRSVLGLSVACARCHDHKFDPIPTKDYYALAGILRSTYTLYGTGPRGIKGPNDSELQPIGPDGEKLAGPAAEHLKQVGEQTQKRNDARSGRYRIVRNVADLKQKLGRAGADKDKLQQDIDRSEAEIKKWDEKIKLLDAELKALEDNPPPQPGYALAARDFAKPENCRVHVRGETTNLGDLVPRGVLQIIDVPGLPPIGPNESGRRQLAEWLTHPANPLTPRVAVNRVWLHLFGRGLVSTPDDFGVNGARPSHPELLDHLALRFVADGWSVKKLIRAVVLSRTYQMSSEANATNQEADPDNVLLWRMRPRRLEAEAFRDAVLAVSGQLDRRPLERSVVARLDPYKQPEFNSFALFLKPDQMEHAHRSVYLPIVRGNLPELLKLFDFADPSMPAGQRDETVVPAQASFLMNSPWMIAQARHAAERLLRDETLDDEGRLDRLYVLALARTPTESERQRAREFLQQPVERLNAKGAASEEQLRLEQWTSLCQVLLVSAEFRYIL